MASVVADTACVPAHSGECSQHSINLLLSIRRAWPHDCFRNQHHADWEADGDAEAANSKHGPLKAARAHVFMDAG
jgi:hypothetical protein